MDRRLNEIFKLFLLISIPLVIFLIIIRIPMNEKVLYLFSKDNLHPKLIIPLLLLVYISFKRKGYIGNIYSLTVVSLLYAMGLMWQWNSGYTNTAQLAGYFPTSDAREYYNQAYSLLTTGTIKGIASFRPLFHIFFASLLSITNLNLIVIQGIFAFINALGSFLAANELRKTHGALAAAIFILAGFFFAKIRLYNFMTEQLGFLLGNLAFAFLWNGSINKNKINIILGIFSLSLGLVVRPGAMLILPLLIFWIGWFYKRGKKYSLYISLLALGVGLIPFILNSFYSSLHVTSNQPLFSNYGYTLYGVVTGNQGWTQFSIDYPGKTSNEAYGLAWHEFIDHPNKAFVGFSRAYIDYINPNVINAFSFLGFRKPIYYYPVFILFFINIAFLIKNTKQELNSLILFSLTGILLSVPFAPTRDVGYRSYTVSNPFLLSVLVCCFPWVKLKIKYIIDRIKISLKTNIFQMSSNLSQYNYRNESIINSNYTLRLGYSILVLILSLTFIIPLFVLPTQYLSVPIGQFHCGDNQIPIGFWTHKNAWIHVVSNNSILNGIQIPVITKDKLAKLIDGYAYHRDRGYDRLVKSINPGNSFGWIPYNYFDPNNQNNSSKNIAVINTDLLPQGSGFIQFCGEKARVDENKPITEYLILEANLHKTKILNGINTYSPQYVNIANTILFLGLFMICLESIIAYIVGILPIDIKILKVRKIKINNKFPYINLALVIVFGILFFWILIDSTIVFLLSDNIKDIKLYIKIGFLLILTCSVALVWKYFKRNKEKIYQLFNRQEFKYLLIGTSLVIIMLLFLNHYKLINFPYQLEYREGAILLTTEAFLNGINPYKLSNFPIYINVYGFLYNLAVLPFALLFGNSLELHRLITFIFILSQMGLIIVLLRKNNVSWILSLLFVLILWSAQTFFTNPLTRPDAMGEFLFLGSLIVPYLFKFDYKGITIGLFLSLLGFYTKPYFVIGAPILIFYLFLFISKRKAIISAVIYMVVFISIVFIVNKYFECYFLEIIISNIVGYRSKFSHLYTQSKQFLKEFWGLFLVGGIISYESTKIKSIHFLQINKKEFIKILSSLKLCYFTYILIVTILLVVFYLGNHIGTEMVYFYQFILPFFILFIANKIEIVGEKKGILILIILLNLVTFTNTILKRDNKAFIFDNNWIELEQYLFNYEDVLNSPVAVSLLISHDIPIIDSGQSIYSYSPPIQMLLTPDIDEINKRRNEYQTKIRSKIEERSFDLIMLDQYNQYLKEIVEENYKKTKTLIVPNSHSGQEWKLDLYLPIE